MTNPNNAVRKLGKGGGRAIEAESHARKVLFAAHYSANPSDAKAAYLAAGFTASAPASQARAITALLRDPVVLEAIHTHAVKPAIATREERQQWWTSLMRGQVPEATITERIKASELLGKSQGDFLERVEIVSRGDVLATVRSLIGLDRLSLPSPKPKPEPEDAEVGPPVNPPVGRGRGGAGG